VAWDSNRCDRRSGLTGVNADVEAARDAARNLGMTLRAVDARKPEDLESAFAELASWGAQAVFVFGSPMIFGKREQIVALARQWRLPPIYVFRMAVESGRLTSYGVSTADLYLRAAGFVDKILRGANPARMPVELPTRYELVINLKAAKALGFTIPRSLLLRADEVIQGGVPETNRDGIPQGTGPDLIVSETSASTVASGGTHRPNVLQRIFPGIRMSIDATGVLVVERGLCFGGAMTTTIVVQNPCSRKLERYDIGRLTPEELQALPLDERVCEEVAAAVAPCLPEEFLAAYVVRVGVVEAGERIIGAWTTDRVRSLFAPMPGTLIPQP
jgi:hypothetical protein